MGLIRGAGFITAMLDFVKVGWRDDFVNEVVGYLQAGKAALVADVEEDKVLPTDLRMEAIEGVVFRQPRADTAYLLLERELASHKGEITALRAEFDQSTGEEKTRLQAKLENIQAKLRTRIEHAKSLEEATQKVVEFKIKSLEEQVATAHAPWKTILQQRIGTVHAEYNKRISSLRQARTDVQDALAD